MEKTNTIILVGLLILLVLAWAPWIDNQVVYDRVFAERAHIDGTIDKQTGKLICDYNVSWFPFGRYISSCEGSYTYFFWQETDIEIKNYNPVFVSLGNEHLDMAVEDYLLSQEYFSWKTDDKSSNFCVFENLNQGSELFPFYLWVRCGEFIMENGELRELSGMSGPVKIDYPNELSFYDLGRFSYIVPRDGSYYSEDIKEIFPDEVQEKINNFNRTSINIRIENVARESL